MDNTVNITLNNKLSVFNIKRLWVVFKLHKIYEFNQVDRSLTSDIYCIGKLDKMSVIYLSYLGI